MNLLIETMVVRKWRSVIRLFLSCWSLETKPSYSEKLKKWQALKSMAPLMDNLKQEHWVQLAGHDGSFEVSDEGTILKKLCTYEKDALEKLMTDPLRPFVPEYHGVVEKDTHKFIELQDLLHGFRTPCVMDCKMGTRTYLEEELAKAEKCPKPREDMYDKMVKIDPAEPTEHEHMVKAVTKPRYMQWRESISSTSTLGFRIEGIKQCSDGTSSTNFKTSRDFDTLKSIFKRYTKGNLHILKQYLDRLMSLKATLLASPFFNGHELIGSSLLFIHDTVKAKVWIIDFGKTLPLPKNCNITHYKDWERGNHEDGYLFGLDNMINMFKMIIDEVHTSATPADCDATTITNRL